MKMKYFVVAALAIGSGWSSRVTYNHHLALTKSQVKISRAIASKPQKDKLTLKNIKDEASEISELSKKLTRPKEDLISELKLSSLKDLISEGKSKKEILANIKKVRQQLRLRLSKAELFLSQNEKSQSNDEKQKKSQQLNKVSASLKASRKILDEFNTVDFEHKLENALEIAEKEKAVEIERNMGDLNAKLCNQEKKINSLTSKLKNLIKDKEKVVSKVNEDKKNQNIPSLFNPAFFMNPAQFFGPGLFANQQNSGPDYSFLNKSPAMGGVDMNFLMLTSLLGQKTGMGLIGNGRTSINYSPVYYNSQGYSSPLSVLGKNFGDFNFKLGQAMIPAMQPQQLEGPFRLNKNASMIPSYPRSNALQSLNTSTNTVMGIFPNAQKL